MTYTGWRNTLIGIVSLLVFGSGSAWAQEGCTASERQTIMNYTQRAYAAASQGDMQRYIQILQQLSTEKFSQSCMQALNAAAAAQQQQQYGRGSVGRPPSVYDHGGGTYSVPGVGACGPSGCVGF